MLFRSSIEVYFFARQYETMGEALIQDQIVKISGRVGIRDDSPSITASSVTPLELKDRSDMPVEISLDARQCVPPVLNELASTLRSYPGPTRVRVTVKDRSQETLIDLGDELTVDADSSFFATVKGLLGAGSIQ